MSKHSNNMGSMNRKGRQRGIAMLELILAIAIVGTIVVLGVSRFKSAQDSTDVTNETSNVAEIFKALGQTKTTTGYGTSGSNLTPGLIAAGGVPKNMTLLSGTTIYNTWDGTVTAASNSNTYTVTFNAVPKEACVNVVQQVSKNPLVASTKVGAAAARNGEVGLAGAAADCTGATNSITWTSFN